MIILTILWYGILYSRIIKMQEKTIERMKQVMKYDYVTTNNLGFIVNIHYFIFILSGFKYCVSF
jgi:hypothetical protein